ncbi:GDXG family lipase [Salmonella enterica]|nr:GDXG family lipase [Salmonella enterica]
MSPHSELQVVRPLFFSSQALSPAVISIAIIIDDNKSFFIRITYK